MSHGDFFGMGAFPNNDHGRRQAARNLIKEAGLIDLHVDTFIPHRLYGYNIFRRHGGGPFFGHLDLPRIEEAGLSGAMWSITTNILRPPRNRWQAFRKNWHVIHQLLADSAGRMRFVRNVPEYQEARISNVHAVFLAIQGGNALEHAPGGLESLPDPGLLTRMTLVHMTDSVYGATSCPYFGWRTNKSLTTQGRQMIEQLNANHIFVDLAHIHADAFWDAMDVHDPSLPVIVSHTGASGVRDSWRNLSDKQIKAVAKGGGVIGVLFHKPYLRRKNAPSNAGMVLDHLEHIINIAGEDYAAIGSDYDGFIRPPRDLYSGENYLWLVELMLQRGWAAMKIKKILSANFLRAMAHMRP